MRLPLGVDVPAPDVHDDLAAHPDAQRADVLRVGRVLEGGRGKLAHALEAVRAQAFGLIKNFSPVACLPYTARDSGRSASASDTTFV